MSAYKIKDLELLSGIKAHTIRMWEKRYGILNSERTTTQIRTYTDDDLTALLNISILNQNGVKISKIAKMSQSDLKQEVQKINDENHHESAVLSILINALIDLDEEMFERMVESTIRKEGMIATYFNYFLPFLERIGTMWVVGTISPAQEHFVSALLRNRIILETAKLPIPKNNARKFVIFCRPNEYHEISLLFYHYLIRSKGHASLYLGQNLPFEAIITLSKQQPLQGLISSFISPLGTGEKNEVIQLIEQVNLPLYAGGSASFPLFEQEHALIKPIQELVSVE